LEGLQSAQGTKGGYDPRHSLINLSVYFYPYLFVVGHGSVQMTPPVCGLAGESSYSERSATLVSLPAMEAGLNDHIWTLAELPATQN
jgi:hypothetical protein